jgi:hypothetical protein
MTEQQQHERRRDSRVTFRTFARLKYPGERIFDECETRDISVSGVFVQGVSGVKPGEKCDVEFHLTGRTSSLVLEMSAETVRVQEGGVALHFFDIDEDSFYHLQNVVYFNYKESGGVGEVTVAEDVSDESLYLSLDEGDKSPLPDNYLDDVEVEDDLDGDDDRDIYGSYGSKKEDDDSDD